MLTVSERIVLWDIYSGFELAEDIDIVLCANNIY